MKRLIVALLLLLGTRSAEGQVNIGDSCFSLHSNWYWVNPDSVLTDTCHSTNTHPVFWVKRGYRIWFDSDAIKLSWAPADTDLEVDWRHIDTAFPTLRSVFADFDSTVAHILFKKLAPADTSHSGNKPFDLIFDRYVNSDTVKNRLKDAAGIYLNLMMHAPSTGVLQEQPATGFQVTPNPCDGYVNVFGLEARDRIQINDINGHLVYNRNADKCIEFDTRRLTPGAYIVHNHILSKVLIVTH